MAGKSELIISILRRFNPIWASKPPSSIIYCARGSIPNSYLTALRQVAAELQVKLHIFPDGVSSLPFKTSWHRALRKRQISERQEAEYSRGMEENNTHNVNDYHDDYDDDDDDDDDGDANNHRGHEDNNRKKPHQNTNNKECIELMTDIIQNRRPMSQPRSNSLSTKPKMTSLKKIKNFLTLNDRNMKRSRHIALAKERRKTMPVKRQNVESETNAAGGVLTRSKTRLLGHDAHTDAPRPIHDFATAQKRKKKNNTDKINEPSNDLNSHTRESHDSNVFPNENTSSNGNKHTPLREVEEEAECEWLRSSVLILDDHLCFNSIPPAFKSGGGTSSESNASTSSTAKQNKEQQQEILQFIQSLTTLYCHHMGIHLIATRY